MTSELIIKKRMKLKTKIRKKEVVFKEVLEWDALEIKVHRKDDQKAKINNYNSLITNNIYSSSIFSFPLSL